MAMVRFEELKDGDVIMSPCGRGLITVSENWPLRQAFLGKCSWFKSPVTWFYGEWVTDGTMCFDVHVTVPQ